MRGRNGVTCGAERAIGENEEDWARILEGIRGTITYGWRRCNPIRRSASGTGRSPVVEPADVDDLCRVVAQAHAERLPILWWWDESARS